MPFVRKDWQNGETVGFCTMPLDFALSHFCCHAAVLGQKTKSGLPSAIISAGLPPCDAWLSWRLLEREHICRMAVL